MDYIGNIVAYLRCNELNINALWLLLDVKPAHTAQLKGQSIISDRNLIAPTKFQYFDNCHQIPDVI